MFWFFWGWILGWFKGIFCTSSNKAIGCNPLELSFKIFSVHHSSVADAFLSLSLPQALSPSNLPLVSLISAGPASLYVMALSCLWHYQEEVRRRQLKEGVAKNKTKQNKNSLFYFTVSQTMSFSDLHWWGRNALILCYLWSRHYTNPSPCLRWEPTALFSYPMCPGTEFNLPDCLIHLGLHWGRFFPQIG